jgi:hypothetical protein
VATVIPTETSEQLEHATMLNTKPGTHTTRCMVLFQLCTKWTCTATQQSTIACYWRSGFKNYWFAHCCTERGSLKYFPAGSQVMTSFSASHSHRVTTRPTQHRYIRVYMHMRVPSSFANHVKSGTLIRFSWGTEQRKGLRAE